MRSSRPALLFLKAVRGKAFYAASFSAFFKE
jgi:hypothetical protein